MMFFLLLMTIVVVIVLGKMARTNAALRIPAGIATVVAVALAVLHLASFAPEPHLPIDLPPEEALGLVLGNQIAEAFPEGGKILVFQPDTDEERLLTIFTARMDGLKRVLKDTHEIVTRGPLLRYGSTEDRQAWFRMETGFPVAEFQQWAADDGDAVAAVSMVGLPTGRLGGQTGLPPLYVVELRGLPWDSKRLPEGIASVITYRDDREVDPERTKELLAVFAQNYSMYPPPAEPADPQEETSEPDGN